MKRHLRSLREYLDALAAIGELQAIGKRVELDLEIGAICRRAGETGAPAPLFQNIRGIEQGFRVLGAPGGVSCQPGLYLSRIALALGLEPRATGRQVVDALVEARGKPGLPPRLVPTGPCQENILTGDAVDLTRLPAPLLHDGDGGRYLNTYGIICVETPDKSWRNWSIARIMVVDKARMAGIIAPNQHIGMVRQAWTDIGKAMPYALALGVEPFLPFVGGMPLPEYMNEADFAGAYFGEAIEVAQCKTVDLQVPATAEIVVEGHVSLTETALEGPMGEYAGYLWDGPGSPKPVYHVSAVTHRHDAVLPISVAGEPVEENHTAWGVPNAAEIVHVLRGAGLPVATAWSPFESANHLYVIAAARDWRTRLQGLTGREFCRRIGEALFATKAGMGTPKYMVVNDSIDVTNLKEVVWALMTRSHPGPQGEVVFNAQGTNPLVAYLDGDEKMSLRTAKVIYNALDPDHLHGKLPKRVSFAHSYPAELQARVLRNWSEYGYRPEEHGERVSARG